MLGKTALAKYRLLRRLGSGSNGEVYLAQPLDGGRQVVVKRIFPHIAQHARFRTLFEAAVRPSHESLHYAANEMAPWARNVSAPSRTRSPISQWPVW